MTFIDEDTKLILSLLTEYAGKLISLCKQVERMREQLFTRVFFSYLFLTCTLLLYFVYIQSDGRALYSIYSFLFFIMASLSAAVVLQSIYRSIRARKALKNDGSLLAAKLLKVIRTASQVQEHIDLSYAGRLEFDLRLAEAESALKSFEQLK